MVHKSRGVRCNEYPDDWQIGALRSDARTVILNEVPESARDDSNCSGWVIRVYAKVGEKRGTDVERYDAW